MTQQKKFINKDYFISVVAVIDNDQDVLEKFIQETIGVLKNNYDNYELVLIDNDSTDKTQEHIEKVLHQEECIRCIKLSRKYDPEVAMTAGLDTVIGDIIILLEPQTDPPELIPSFIEKTIANSGVVYGIRRNYYEFIPSYYKAGKVLFHLFCKAFFKFSPPRNAGFFMGLSRAALNAIVQIKGKTKFLRVFGKKIGFNTTTIEYDIQPLGKKLKARTLKQSLDYGFAIIFTNSNRPLRIISILGLFAAALNALYVLSILLLAFFNKNMIPAVMITSLQSAVMFFLLFLIVTFFIEYAIRNIENSREGPAYYIDFEKNSAVMIRNEELRRNIFESPR